MIVPDSTNYILTENPQSILDTQGIQDPIRDGAYNITQPGDSTAVGLGVYSDDDKISSHQTAQVKTMNIIKSFINYALGMVSLVALVYLLYHGFLILTAAGDETQYKKGLKGLKFAAIAIAGIWLSWLIVSFIFWIIALVIWP